MVMSACGLAARVVPLWSALRYSAMYSLPVPRVYWTDSTAMKALSVALRGVHSVPGTGVLP
jgi:hypothetical protein